MALNNDYNNKYNNHLENYNNHLEKLCKCGCGTGFYPDTRGFKFNIINERDEAIDGYTEWSMINNSWVNFIPNDVKTWGEFINLIRYCHEINPYSNIWKHLFNLFCKNGFDFIDDVRHDTQLRFIYIN
jgi:hypothetical protein